MIRSGERVAFSALFACALLASGNGVGIRFSNRELAPLWGACLRFALAGAILTTVAAALRLTLPSWRALANAAMFGILNFTTGFGIFYVALVHMHAGFGTIVLGLVPLATLALSVAWGQERMRAQGLIGVLLAAAGITAMSQTAIQGSLPPTALVAALISVASLAQAAVLVRRSPPMHPVTMNAVGMLSSAAVLLLASVLADERLAIPRETSTWIAIGYLSLAGSGLLFVLYLVMLRHWDASRAAYVFVLSPVGAVTLSAWLDDEAIGRWLVLGGLAALAGVYVGALQPRSSLKASPRQ